jgi:anthranilate/para-aminobenzoate synthase component I
VLQHESGHVEVFGSLAFREDAATVLARSSAGTEAPPLCRQPAKSSSAQPPAGQRQQYIDGVRSILRHIEAGDVYQANLAWEQTEISVACAAKAWLRLRRENPASRGCYLRQGGVEIVSNSPELFMNYGPISRCMVSAPIKGTAGVAGGQKAKQALERSPKERAELTMIVDLVRNDLGRVAAIGTVAASKRQIRQCGDLWHAEQTVSATAAMGIDAVSAVAAAFPPGSVTGAPKVKAMSIINDLEAGPRGVYTGAIGWFADGGGAHLNVAIRTATVIDGIGRFHVGAGIVAQSEPEQEWRETLDKARALSRCLSTR